MKHFLCLFLIVFVVAAPALAQRPAVGETVFRSREEHKAFLFMIGRDHRQEPRQPQTDPALLAAISALQANQSRMIELLAAMTARQQAPSPVPAPSYPPETYRQQPPTIIIIDGSRPRNEIPLEPRPRNEIPLEPRPRNEIPLEPRPRNEIPLEPRPRNEIPLEPGPRNPIPLDGAPRNDLGKPNPSPAPGSGKPLIPPRGAPKGPPTGYMELSKTRGYTSAVWR